METYVDALYHVTNYCQGRKSDYRILNSFDGSSEGFGFIGRISFDCEVQHDLTKRADHVNMEKEIVKIISFSVNGNQMVSIQG